jgi:hypothetical protein
MVLSTFATLPFGLLKLLKLGKIMGRPFSYFTATNVITPALGAHIPARELLGVTGLRTALYLITGNTLSFFKFLYHMPSLTGALYFRTMLDGQAAYQHRLMHAAVPLICMALFISNPVGGQAWVYSLYWIIPVVLAIMPRTNVFLSALGSTFTTHAVGSVLFLFCTPMTASFWLALMPVVLFERLLFASGITGAYYAIGYGKYLFKLLSVRLAHA